MHDLIYREDLLYEDFEDPIEIELKLIDGWLCIETPIERKIINTSELRYDNAPRNILGYIINEHPNEIVTIYDLENANLTTSRDLRQVAIKAGIKGYVRDVFMPVRDKYQLKILNKVTLKAEEVDALIDSLN